MKHLRSFRIFFLDRKNVPLDVSLAGGSPLCSTLHRVLEVAFRSDRDTGVRSCDHAKSGRLHLYVVPTIAERRLCDNER